jgi:hypothetical protein
MGRKFQKVVGAVRSLKTIKNIATSDNPAGTVGKIARIGFTAAHPIIGTLVGGKVESAVTNLTQRAMDTPTGQKITSRVGEFISGRGSQSSPNASGSAGEVSPLRPNNNNLDSW